MGFLLVLNRKITTRSSDLSLSTVNFSKADYFILNQQVSVNLTTKLSSPLFHISEVQREVACDMC